MTDAKLVIFLEMFVFLAENNIKTPLFGLKRGVLYVLLVFPVAYFTTIFFDAFPFLTM